MVEPQLFFLCNDTLKEFALWSCLTSQGAERCERRGWVERCSASQAGGITLAVALPGLSLCLPRERAFLSLQLLPCHTEGGRKQKDPFMLTAPTAQLTSAADKPWGRVSLPLQSLRLWFKTFTHFHKGQWKSNTFPNSTRQWIMELGSFFWS